MTTDTFYVDSETKEILPVLTNPREYFRKDGQYEGKADMIIEVFASVDHLKHAAYLYHVLCMGNLKQKYSHIKIEVKD